MAISESLRLVVVTPEKPVIDQVVQSVQFPLADGKAGVLPGRAPLIGRLGHDELEFIDKSGNEARYFIDGGFVQIVGDVVTLLTGSCRPITSLTKSEGEAALAVAKAKVARTDLEVASKQREQDRARRIKELATR